MLRLATFMVSVVTLLASTLLPSHELGLAGADDPSWAGFVGSDERVSRSAWVVGAA